MSENTSFSNITTEYAAKRCLRYLSHHSQMHIATKDKTDAHYTSEPNLSRKRPTKNAVKNQPGTKSKAGCRTHVTTYKIHFKIDA